MIILFYMALSSRTLPTNKPSQAKPSQASCWLSNDWLCWSWREQGHLAYIMKQVLVCIYFPPSIFFGWKIDTKWWLHLHTYIHTYMMLLAYAFKYLTLACWLVILVIVMLEAQSSKLISWVDHESKLSMDYLLWKGII